MWQQKWVLGNWKMNGRQYANQALLTELSQSANENPHVYSGIAVPAVYTAQALACAAGSALAIGVQDVSRFADDGAFTGEISAAMFADIGVAFALIGHSERRQYFQEDNAVLVQKLRHCQAAQLLPVLCVGETLDQREAGQAEAVVAAQLALLADLSWQHVAIAYEPVWAIGTGKIPTTAQIAQMHGFIYRQILSLCGEDVKIRVLYGGSVNATNAAEILAVDHVDGALVGGASLHADSFAAIIQAACAPLPKS
ncbi:triose-phosphate isomerase [Neisseriaceae bacterium ESL0693]|nr:triose-phosphate isomerase [Neisseriaceae bacterium ESL0693]